jgi:hypothetical protein
MNTCIWVMGFIGGVPVENRQTLLHNIVPNTPRHERGSNSQHSVHATISYVLNK